MHGRTRVFIGWIGSILLVTSALAQTTTPPDTPAAPAAAGIAPAEPANTPPPEPAATDKPAEPAATNGDAAKYPYEGEVAGDNVYVRSGAGVNWYPTTKLGRGTMVRVMGAQSGWLRIVPPPGSFSYIDAAAVERTAGSDKAVTKVDGVYVKAGGDLSARKTAAQQILPKGTEVTILGEAEGFLKIVPPSGSYLYISDQFVQAVGPEGPKFARTDSANRPTSPAKEKPIDSSPEGASVVASGTTGGEESSHTAVSTATTGSGGPAGKHRTMLESVEADLRTRLASDQTGGYQGLIDRYKPLAEQDEDRVAQAVAKARLDQLQSRAELEQIVADARNKTQSTDSFVEKLGEDRRRIQDAKLPAEKRFWDFKGELRRSLAFNELPNRYRLADPESNRTIAYIDVPVSSGIDAAQFLSRYVGIRISSQYFSTAAKVTIAVASEIVGLPSPVPGQGQPGVSGPVSFNGGLQPSASPSNPPPTTIIPPPAASPRPAPPVTSGNVEYVEATAPGR